MDPEVLAAVGAVLVALTGLIAALTAMWNTIKKTNTALAANTKTTDSTHELVNSNADSMKLRLDQLESALAERGIRVPVDPALASAQARVDKKIGRGNDG